MTSSEPLHVKVKDGQTLAGPVTTSDGNLQVATANSGNVQAPKDAVIGIRNDAEESLYENSLHPGLLQGWTGGSNVSFALTRGNSQTKNLALAFTLARTTLHDKLGLYANSVYATNDAPGAVPSTTANAIQSGIRYDHDIAARLFGFVTADFQTDALQGLNLRSVPGAGLGYHVIKNERTRRIHAQGAHQHGHQPEARVLSGLRRRISRKFPVRNGHEAKQVAGMAESFGDIYVSNPPVGKRKNDIMLTTGLNPSFTHPMRETIQPAESAQESDSDCLVGHGPVGSCSICGT